MRASPPRSARPLWLCRRALATHDAAARTGRLLNGLDVDYVEIADYDPPVLAAAVRVGSTRLIDNVVLDSNDTVEEA